MSRSAVAIAFFVLTLVGVALCMDEPIPNPAAPSAAPSSPSYAAASASSVSTAPVEHEDGRCRCVCPALAALLEAHLGANSTSESVALIRQVYVRSESASDCSCESVVMPRLAKIEFAEWSRHSANGGTRAINN